MKLIIQIFVIILVLALVLYALALLPIGQPWHLILQILAIAAAVVGLLQLSGVFKGGVA